MLTKTQAQFLKVLGEMATVRQEKVAEYGDQRYRETHQRFNMLQAFSDVHRKYIRLRTQSLGLMDPGEDRRVLKEDQREALRESYLDMANYAAMGVQLLDNRPLTGEDRVLNRFPIQQVAIYTTGDPDILASALSMIFGVEDWIADTVTANGEVFGSPVAGLIADLRFNYQLIPGVEFEILHYRDFEQSWLRAPVVNSPMGLSHLGLHVDDVGEAVRAMDDKFDVAQLVRTNGHTNPAIRGKRQYSYAIMDSRDALGFDLKFIQRHLL